nr:EOG090X0B7I [Scapholeberis mucronata]
MEIPPPFQQLPADPKFIDQIVNQIKSQGTFDQWRRECLADVDTKPAYQNLTFRVDNAVAGFLGKQKWRPDMVKNQVRENLRKHILELGIIDRGVDRIVEQVVQPKVLPLFHPAVEDAIYNFLGIKNPRAESYTQLTETTNSSASPKKAFRPMPVSIPSRDKEDGTPPPGEEFDLEAITPSSESRCGSSLKKELGDDVSDVSMEDSRPMPETGLERICSPVSPQSIPPGEKQEEAANNRVGSALSAISSGDDLPSDSPRGESPHTPDEFQANKNQPPDRQQDSLASSDDDDQEEDDEDDFSSPEFEKLEPNAPSSRTVTPVPGEEEPEEKEEVPIKVDDHYKWRPKLDCRDPDRKPDEDPGDLSSKKTGDPTNQTSRNQLSGNSSHASRDIGLADTGKSTKSTRSDTVVEPAEAETDSTPKEVTERSISSSSKDASRSKSDSHKSERREKSHKDKSRSKDRERDRDRDRERRREREKREEADRRSKSHHSKSSHRDREERDRDERKKSSSHRDKDRDRHKDRDRNRSKSDADRHRPSSSSKDKDRKSSGAAAGDKFRKEVSISPLPTVHPKAYLWKRPAEKPTALWDYLARFPDHVFDESVDVSGGLSDVSVSSVSSYDNSDAESTVVVVLSEVEIDSDMEQAIVHSGGRVVYPDPPETEAVKNDDKPQDDSSDDDNDDDDAAIESDYTPASDEFARAESCLRDQQLNINNNKRVRKLNTRYSDSYVGSELRKIIKTKHSSDTTQRSPRLGGSKLLPARENQENCMQGSLSEDVQEREEVSDYAPPDAKRLKSDQPLPSSPESVQSDLTPQLPHVATSTPPPADVQSTVEDESTKDTISPNGRRRSLA